ncbi:MAG: NADH-ubiquinone oxidoreductase [Sulfobacillus acidophilus]|uniref:NADH-ubiquinone oxidoreductase n=1 Tax=Sulfobacillus acidophilus TaxID=53633 RepID=A0A2T2WMP1_9FIRM|nr:MAG: NADH-ubiquinone oxidoreductase [Sulfobacillus acidophilus]
MNGSLWVMGWIGFSLISLAGAALLTTLKPRWTRHWLSFVMTVGSVALVVMSFSLSPAHASRMALPHPWPTLVMAPLPLAGLWAIVAGILFLSATLLTMRRTDSHRVFYALLPLMAGVGVYVWSGDGLMLLLTWEFISAVTYLGLVTTRRSRPVWNAGWALLALSEFGGMLLLIALAWLMPTHTQFLSDSLIRLARLAPTHSPAVTNIIMLMALVAFGVKAGLFPVMIWMPMAEPEAPGVVAGIFSGLLTALAVSGVLAMTEIAGSGLSWAIVMLVLGVLGALSGALYSVVSRHVKRVLAYSTLEILGLVFAALALWRILSLVAPHNVGSSLALDSAIVLLVMHAGAKFVLFAASDYTGQWGHTLDRLGGLIHTSSATALLSLLGILALGAFPPLGGFVGEWLLLESILKPISTSTSVALVHLALMITAGFIALTVAIGLAAYLRWFGFIFLGIHRSSAKDIAPPAREWVWALALPLLLMLVPGPGVPWFLPWLNRSLHSFLTSNSPVVAPSFIHPQTALPLIPIGANLIPAPGAQGTVFFPQSFNVGDPYVLLFMALFLSVVVGLIRHFVRRKPLRRVAPWNGGATPFSPQTTWSAEGFTHPIRLAFSRFYGLSRERTQRQQAHFYRHTVINRLEEQLYRPMMQMGTWLGRNIQRIQSGRVTQYVAYVWIFALIGMIIGAIH